jgi:hypothetical protein
VTFQHDHGASGHSGGFGIPMPELGEPCERCEARPGLPHPCPGDGRSHGHGMIHVKNEGLAWVCCPCADEIAKEWNKRG